MRTIILNGWGATPKAWARCHLAAGARIFSYLEQLDGLARESLAASTEKVFLAGWSMGGEMALQLTLEFPDRVAALLLLAATPRMMADVGWRGMSPHRLQALETGFRLTKGAGLFGGNPATDGIYEYGDEAALARGIAYLRETDLRARLVAARETPVAGTVFGGACPVAILQSERDPIVRPENAAYLKTIFPQASVMMLPGVEHAIPAVFPTEVNQQVEGML